MLNLGGFNKEFPAYFSNFPNPESPLNLPFVDITTWCCICMNRCPFPSQICLTSKPGDQHGRVTPTPALSQKVKASAQLEKHGLDSKGNYRSSGGVLSVHFWKASCMGNSGRCHWAATSLLKLQLRRVHHHRALKSFLWALNPVVSILEQRAAGVPGLGISPRFGEQLPNWKNNYMGFFFFHFSATQPSSSTVPKTEDQRPQLGGCHLVCILPGFVERDEKGSSHLPARLHNLVQTPPAADHWNPRCAQGWLCSWIRDECNV